MCNHQLPHTFELGQDELYMGKNGQYIVLPRSSDSIEEYLLQGYEIVPYSEVVIAAAENKLCVTRSL